VISGQDARWPHSQDGCATKVNAESRLAAANDCGYRFEVLNYIWLALVLLAVAIGGWNNRWKEVTDGAFDGAKTAVTIALGLIGVMALWLGVMRLAERAGLVQKIARALRPIMRRLFPDVPAEHPAMGAMLMNMAANMLGLGNAATPLGLRAMRDLESLNPHPGTATNAMCTFLAINTASVQLIPTTAIAILVAAGSTRPTAIVGTALLATLCAATTAIIAVKTLERLPWFARPVAVVAGRGSGEDAAAATSDVGAAEATADDRGYRTQPTLLGRIATVALLTFFLLIFVRIVWPPVFGNPLTDKANGFVRSVNALSLLAIPFLLSFFPIYAAARRIKVYEEFVEGAKEGFNVILRIIPFLVTILVAIGMFKGAGGIDLLTKWLTPVLAPLHFPPDLLPLALMRPLSGSATLALLTEIVHRLGPESIVSLTAATIYGSTETTFYVAAVYFGSVGIKQTRHAIPAGLLADLVGVIASVAICRAVL
jgi:spore maturation protein SpmA